MNIRELLKARNEMPRIVTVPVAGLGEVRVRRVSTQEGADFKTGIDAVAATIVDEQDAVLFKDAAAAREVDWGFIRALLGAYDQANRIDIEEAAKN